MAILAKQPDPYDTVYLVLPSPTEIGSLVVNHHTRLLAFLLHVVSDLFGSFEDSQQVLPCKTSKISLRPSTSADQFGKLAKPRAVSDRSSSGLGFC